MEIGGQAVVEGVMMRNKDKFAVAVRLPDGKIKVKTQRSSAYPKIFKFPFVRGVVGLGYTLVDGIKALVWSSNQQLDKNEKLTNKELTLTIGISFLFSLLIFVALPFLAAQFFSSDQFWFNVIDGFFRVGLFMGYLGVIALMKDVKTLFAYHGAEHKVISCYEAGKPLTVKNAKKFGRFHPRCGTSFIFMVLLVSIFVYSLVIGPWWVKFGSRIFLLPAIAAISYEIIKLSGRYKHNFLVKSFIAPGLWLQRLTTKEPNNQQLEVGIKSLQGVLR